jgi:ubiquinone/menaquinone biosynthesis C-methylase UbiE
LVASERQEFIVKLEEKIWNYYRKYYHVELGLPDWEDRIKSRLKEQQSFGAPMVSRLEAFFNIDFRDKKVLVVGAGTGAELFFLAQRGAQAYGIEPNPEAIEILVEKAVDANVPRERISLGFAESLPYGDCEFDFVYCYTVLEHVQDVKKSISEMLRVCKPGGRIFLETPNYRMPYEPHYKLFMPTFLPKPLLRLYLLVRGRPTEFLNSLNFIHYGKLLNYLRHLPVTILPILSGHPKEFAVNRNWVYLIMKYFGIERDVNIIIYKNLAGSKP